MKIQKYNHVLNSKLISWNNVHIALLSDTYVFDKNHMILDIIAYQTFTHKLTTSQLTVDTSVIFDAEDVYVESVDIAYSKHLLIYDPTKGPLFLISDACGLPLTVNGDLRISFSDNFNKVFSYDILSEQYQFGTLLVATNPKNLVSIPDNGFNSRSGIPLDYAEEVDKSFLTDKNSLYKDLSVTSRPHPLTGDLTILTGISAINQSLKNILLSNMYERPFSSHQIAANIRKYLFDFNDDITKESLHREIMTAIQNYEKRIIVLGLKIDAYVEDYNIAVTISYKVKTTTVESSTTIFLKRA